MLLSSVLWGIITTLLLASSALLLGITAALRLFHASYRGTSSSFAGRDPCGEYATCASCVGARYYGRSGPSLGFWPFDRRPVCRWRPADGKCSLSTTSASGDDAAFVDSQYSCPLFPTPYPEDADPPDDFLPDWMGALLDGTDGGFGELTLPDISLPGTHDSMSYDLSRTVSEDGMDGIRRLDEFLHFVSGGTVQIMPGELEEFFRLQSKTQQLTVRQQLDNGIRFLDFRITLEKDTGIWMCLHFLQSARPATHYLRLIREWMDAHPREVVVMWLSREGNSGARGEGQYPGASAEQKRQLWEEIETIFDGLMLDARRSPIRTTALADLARRNHRLVVHASDWAEFTNSSTRALDGALIDNFWIGNAAFDEANALARQRTYLRTAAERNAQARLGGRFTLMSMNTAGQGWQVEGAARERFLPWPLDGLFDGCASRTGIPGPGTWCPETLMDVAQLTSYYDQIALEEAYSSATSSSSSSSSSRGGCGNAAAFPHAFYLDALDRGGAVRTGTAPLFGSARGDDDAGRNGTASYAYVDTVIAYNVHRACAAARREDGDDVAASDSAADEVAAVGRRVTGRWGVRDGGGAAGGGGGCDRLRRELERRRAERPLQLWHDPERCRRDDWPR